MSLYIPDQEFIVNLSSAFKSLLAMLTSFFSAGEKIGQTLDNLASVAEETSHVYLDEARAERLAKIAAREQAAAAITTASLPPAKAAKATAAV